MPAELGDLTAYITEAIGQIANQYLIAVYRAKMMGDETPSFQFDMEQFKKLVRTRQPQLLG